VKGDKQPGQIELSTNKTNAPSYNVFAGANDAGYRDLLAQGVTEPASLKPGDPHHVIAVAGNLTVIRRSDMLRAKAASGIEVTFGESLEQYGQWRQSEIERRRAEGLAANGDPPPFKTRVACNFTGCGTNDYSTPTLRRLL
jgi:hypothetical protein